MLLRSQNIVRGIFTLAESIPKSPLIKVSSLFPSQMSDTKPIKKQKYDGRSKKRQWEDRRTDKGEGLNIGPKKQKNEENQNVTQDTKPDKVKRRKFCLLMGYSGDNYYGMQRNPYTKTIEEDLFKALLKTELINEECYNQVQNMQFQRAARTDKGVSAARQIVSLKLGENIDLAKINAELPEVIRVFAYRRVTKGFNSKSQCDGRTYIYVTPTVAFAPHDQEVSQKDYRLNDETYNRINDLLKIFVGTKNFHNYTSKKKPNDPSANRYIKSFVCEKPFQKEGVEFAILKVHGQSFMLHQIRKMVGCIIAIVRGFATEEVIHNSFKPEKICIPRAPGLGLMLEYVHYDRYNFRYGEDGTHEKLTWEDVENEVNEFRDKYIFPTIINKEIEGEEMLQWIKDKLSKHSYDEDSLSDEECVDNDGDKVESIPNGNICNNQDNKIEGIRS
nr:tRNA pseudouridine synthase A [Leptinotarsa decemlineata]